MNRRVRTAGKRSAVVASVVALALVGSAAAYAAGLRLTAQGLGTVSDDTVTIPRLTPQITGSPAPANIQAGQAAASTATLSGATTTAAGTVTHRLFAVSDGPCATPVAVATSAANGNATTTSGDVQPSTGTYKWSVGYAGDARNAAVPAVCGNGGTLSVEQLAALFTVEASTGLSGRIDAGETLSIAFQSPINPSSICAGWSGAAFASGSTLNNAIKVTVTRTGTTSILSFAGNCPGANSEPLKIGTIDLRSSGYTTSGAAYVFDGTGSNATNMSLSSDRKALSITLGTGGSTFSSRATTGGPAIFTTNTAVRNADSSAPTSGQVSSGLLF